jgi:hypothetical protein
VPINTDASTASPLSSKKFSFLVIALPPNTIKDDDYKCAPVIVAKLDRLSRDVHFVSGLMAERVPFICADLETGSAWPRGSASWPRPETIGFQYRPILFRCTPSILIKCCFLLTREPVRHPVGRAALRAPSLDRLKTASTIVGVITGSRVIYSMLY